MEFTWKNEINYKNKQDKTNYAIVGHWYGQHTVTASTHYRCPLLFKYVWCSKKQLHIIITLSARSTNYRFQGQSI